MALKNLYKEIEEEEKNKTKEKTVTMDIEDFIEEHKKLIKLLKEGSREELLEEAKKQEEELEEYCDED